MMVPNFLYSSRYHFFSIIFIIIIISIIFVVVAAVVILIFLPLTYFSLSSKATDLINIFLS